MVLRMLLFLLLAVAILFGSHYLVYFSLVRFFGIQLFAQKAALLGLLFFLASSFILASLLAHWADNGFTRAIYYLAGLWLGVLANLFLASLLLWIIYGLMRVTGANVSFLVISGFIFCAALTYSAYGVWNALQPRVKNVEVAIKNLPAVWQGKKIVQISDVHLGHIYRATYLQKIVAMSNAQKPEIVVITGDLFDGMDGNLDDLVAPLNQLSAPGGIFFVTGNHETYLGVAEAIAALQGTAVQLIDGQKVERNGLQIVGVGYPAMGESHDLKGALAKIVGFEKDKPSILLYHPPVDVEAARENGISLQLSGHSHKGQLFPFNFITHLVYKGYDDGLHTVGDFSIYTSVGAGTWGPPMRTGNTPEIAAITLK